MAERTQIKHFLISADQTGNIIELSRNEEEVVCLVFDTRTSAFADLHVLISDVNDAGLFERRAQRLRALRHAALAPLLEAGSDDGSWFYVTPHVDGEPLGKYLGRHPQIPVPLAAAMAQGVIEAMLAFRDAADLVTSPGLDAFYVQAEANDIVRVTLTEYLIHAESSSELDPPHLQRARFEQRRTAFNELILSRMGGKKSRLLTTRVESSFFGMALRDLIHSNPYTFLPELAQIRNELEGAIHACAPVTFSGKTRPLRHLAALLPEAALVKEVLEADERLTVTLSAKGNYTHEGEDRRSRTQFRVQVLPSTSLASAEVIQRVRRVSSHLNSRDHASVLRVLNLWQTGSGWAVAETVADGASLAELLQARGRYSPVETLGLLDGINRALNQVEKAGIQCRHVRAEDLFVQAKGGDEDFQVQLRAHPTAESLVLYPQESLGAPPHLIAAPELSDVAVSSASVIYLCGRILGIVRPGESTVHQSHGLPPQALRFYEDALAKCKRGAPPHRVDFLEEFRRLILAATPRLAASALGKGEIALAMPALPAPSPSPSLSLPSLPPSLPTPAPAPPAVDLVAFMPVSVAAQHLPPAVKTHFQEPARHSYEDEHEAPRGLAEALFRNLEPSEVSPLSQNHDSNPAPNPDAWTSVDPRYFQKSGRLPLVVKLFLLLLLSGLTALALAHLSQRAPWMPKISPKEPGKVKRAIPVEPAASPVITKPSIIDVPDPAKRPQPVLTPSDEPVLEPSRTQLATPESGIDSFDPPTRANPPRPAIAVPVPDSAATPQPKPEPPLNPSPRSEATAPAPIRPTETPTLRPLPLPEPTPSPARPVPAAVPVPEPAPVRPVPVTPSKPAVPLPATPSRAPSGGNLPDELPEDEEQPRPAITPRRALPTAPATNPEPPQETPVPAAAPRAVPVPDEAEDAPATSLSPPAPVAPLSEPPPLGRPVPPAEPPDEAPDSPEAVPVPPGADPSPPPPSMPDTPVIPKAIPLPD